MPHMFIENEQTPDLSDVREAIENLDPARLAALMDYAALLQSEQEAEK